MRHVKVLRIECESCKAGPYRTRREHRECRSPLQQGVSYQALDEMQRTHTDVAHPTPDEEGLIAYEDLFVGSNFHCGFKNKTQAKKWFNKSELSMLHSAGFCIREYKVPVPNVRGDSTTRQIIYYNSQVELVTTHSIQKFFNVN